MVVFSVLFLGGIDRILEPEKDIKIIAKTSNCLEVILLVEQKKPGVFFIDTAIPNLDSENTVKNHLGNVFNKLGVSSRLNPAIKPPW